LKPLLEALGLMRCSRLPKVTTHLGKWFAKGTNLSGGELQRIALARAFVRQAQIIVDDD